MTNITKVGIGVAVIKGTSWEDTYVLLGRRKGSHGAGQWAFPGGHLEYMESFKECALRELAEEVGDSFKISELDVCTVTNLTAYAPKHYLDICMYARHISGDPIVMEPDKVSEWKWVFWRDVFALNSTDPENLFATVVPALEVIQGTREIEIYDKEQF